MLYIYIYMFVHIEDTIYIYIYVCVLYSINTCARITWLYNEVYLRICINKLYVLRMSYIYIYIYIWLPPPPKRRTFWLIFHAVAPMIYLLRTQKISLVHARRQTRSWPKYQCHCSDQPWIRVWHPPPLQTQHNQCGRSGQLGQQRVTCRISSS